MEIIKEETKEQLELIAKQQLEIERLKDNVVELKSAIKEINMVLCRPEQWSVKCPDFPKVAMSAIVKARRCTDGHF